MKLTKGTRPTNYADMPKGMKYKMESSGIWIEVTTEDPKAIAYFKSKGLK